MADPAGAPIGRNKTQSKAKAKSSAPIKRSHAKPPKNGIKRPPNCWVLFRRHWDPVVRQENARLKRHMSNGDVCKFTTSFHPAGLR